jgi:hypothetical protein
LEARRLFATFVVDTLADENDGVGNRDVTPSLGRAAL